MSETRRNGPACSSTCDITVSDTIRVTRPGSRLRAELEPAAGSSGVFARSTASAARSVPAITLRPASSSDAVRAPESTHRRTLSSLTPSSSAASLIR